MTVATSRTYPKGVNDQAQLPWAIKRPLSSGSSLGTQDCQGWLHGQNASGYALPYDGTAATAQLISLGWADRDQITATTGGPAEMEFHEKWVSNIQLSTVTASDTLQDTDFGICAWAADNQTVGKLSSYNGVNRSILGVAYGYNYEVPGSQTPLIHVGPVGWQLARSAHQCDSSSAIRMFSADSTGGSTISETKIIRDPQHQTITSVQVFFESSVTASASSFAQVNLYKRSLSGNTSTQFQVATLTTELTTAADGYGAGNATAFVPLPFVLTGAATALQLVETDILTLSTSKSGSGVTLPAFTVRATMRVI